MLSISDSIDFFIYEHALIIDINYFYIGARFAGYELPETIFECGL